MEPSEAPSSADASPRKAADLPPEEPTLQLPSEVPPPTITPAPSSSALSVSLSSPSASSAASPSQPQPQSSQLQKQPIAARTRSHSQLGQSPFTPSTSSSSSSSASSIQSSGISIGLPAVLPHHSRPLSSTGFSYGSSSHFSQPFISSSSPSSSFSQPFSSLSRSSMPLSEQSSSSNASLSSFSQPFSAMPRSSSGIPDQQPNSNSQFKPPVPNVQTIGMIGSLSSAPRMRASGIQHQQRLGQPIDKSLPQTATNQTINTQKFPNAGLSRPASMSSPQSAQSLQQQWMSNQGKQTLGTSFPSSSYRPHMKQQYLPPVTPNQLQVSSSQQQQKQQQQHLQQHNHQQQQNISMPHHVQDLQSNRNQQSLSQQHQQAPKSHASITQRLNNQLGHSGSAVPMTEDIPETGNQILSKRSIQELVAQIDPYEKLEPEVEDVLVEIADDFVESITTAACSLAKHRRSTALEAKDILLHVERNWHMTLPGFGGDDIKVYKKPYTADIHKERLAMIRKSMGMASDAVSTKNAAAGQVAANSKAQPVKSAVPAFTSPKGI